MDDLYQYIQVLNAFTNASGQKINLTKSGIICGARLSVDTKSNISELAQIPIWDNPEYLGIPAEWGRSKTVGLSWLKDKFSLRCKGGKVIF